MSLSTATTTALFPHVVAYLAEVAAVDVEVTAIEIGLMADGSLREYALVRTFDNALGVEGAHRIAAPAPSHAPAWALKRHGKWEHEDLGEDA